MAPRLKMGPAQVRARRPGVVVVEREEVDAVGRLIEAGDQLCERRRVLGDLPVGDQDHDAAPADALERLAGPGLSDHYEPDAKGVSRLMTTGVRVGATNGQVTGRAYRTDGSYDDQVYEKLGPGQWRIKSSTHVPAAR